MPSRRLPRDEAERDGVRLERRRNVAVQASAGTGKTTLIVDRVAGMLATGEIPIDRIAVVTFTRAAAAELRARIRAKLQERGLEKPLRDFGGAWIDTIHGFASRILREYFHLTGTDPSFVPTSSAFDPVEIERRWDGWLLSLPADTLREKGRVLERVSSARLRLLALDMRPLRWLTDVSMLGPDGLEVLRRYREETLAEVERALRTCLDRSHPRYAAFTEVIRWADAVIAGRRPPDPGDLVRIRAVLHPSKRGSSSAWEDWESVKDLFDSARSELVERVFPVLLAEPCREGTWDLAHGFASALLGEWDEDRSRLSFEDLLYMAWRAVSTNGLLARLLRDRFLHVLVDEFQDTSTDQVLLFTSILGDAGLLSPGRITVVADDKQSIYGWRSADIETYREFMEVLRRSGASFHVISTNFRSTSAIIRFVNVFGEVLFAAASPGEAAFGCRYSPIEPRPDAPGGEPVRVLALPEAPADLPGNMSVSGYAALCQAEWLAAEVRRGMAAGARPGDYAVLFLTTTHASPFVDVLEREGIPYFVDATRDYRVRPEIADLRELLGCLLDPGDRLAWIHSLRSMFFGLDDRVITAAVAAGARSDAADVPGCPAGVLAACATLRAWRADLNRLPLADFLTDLLLTSALLPAIAASGYQVGRRLGNLQYVLETVLGGNVRSAEDLLVLLDEEFAPSTTEEPQIPPSDGSAVTLTTIHRAKGLSWKHVVLAAPSRANRPDDAKLLSDPHHGIAALDLGYSLSLTAAERLAARTAHWDRIRGRNLHRTMAERRRLLYVAVTRAEETLTVFRFVGNDKPASPSRFIGDAVEAAVSADPGCCSVGMLEPPELSRLRRPGPALPACEPAVTMPLPMLAVRPSVAGWQPEGARIGDMVHAVLEKIDFGDPVGWLDRNAPDLRRLLGGRCGEVRSLAEAFFSMDLPFRLRDCRVIGREYPVTVAAPDGPRARFVDLLLDAGDRLIVVDYKTDDLAGRRPEVLLEEYGEQQRGYGDAVEAIFGRPVEGFLILLRHGLFVGT